VAAGSALQDPTLELHDATGASIGSNDNWREAQQAAITATGLVPADDREAALVRILQPGAYTAIVRGSGNSSGIALVEAYDLQVTPNSKLANISTRGFVGRNDNVLIGGFIVGASSRYVVRALGPSLRTDGLTNILDDPILELRDGNGSLTATNDDWGSDANSSSVQQLQLAPPSAKESALYINLAAGPHTAIVRGKDATTGIGLVEVYLVP